MQMEKLEKHALFGLMNPTRVDLGQAPRLVCGSPPSAIEREPGYPACAPVIACREEKSEMAKSDREMRYPT